MYIIIIGAGRTGSRLAGQFSQEENEVVVVDKKNECLQQMPAGFSGFSIEGNALEHGTLERAGMDKADLVVVTTDKDKVNYMITRMARDIYEAPLVLVRVIDPRREQMFFDLERVEVYSQISLLVESLLERVNELAAKKQGDQR